MEGCAVAESASGQAGLAVPAGAPASLYEKAVDLGEQITYCTPGRGLKPCAYFLTQFCATTHENRIETIPTWRFVIEDCLAMEKGLRESRGIFDEKSRQMLATIMTAGQHLWRTMMTFNASGFITSRKERLVDDGGERSTTDSIMGKMRRIYERLPDGLRAYAPVEFSKLRVSCERTGSFVVGEGASGEAGRGGTYDLGDADEAAFILGDGWFRAMQAACRVVRLRSTPNGKGNRYARVKFPEQGDAPSNFIMLRKHWSRHPDRARGLYRDALGRLRSPWYDHKTAGLLADEIAREYDISYAHSVSGQVWPEFDEDNEQHLSWDVVYDPTLPLYVGMDFGVAAATVAIFFQVHGREMWIIGDYESWEGDPDDHAPAIWAKAQELGFRGEKRDIRFYGDPAGDNREQSNKNSTVMRAYRALGFTQFSRAPRRSVKDGVRMVRRKIKRGEVRWHMQCSNGRRRIPDYRYRTDNDGRVTGGEVIADTPSVHYGDALRFGALGVFPVDEQGPAIHIPRDDEPALALPFLPVGMRPAHQNPFRPVISPRPEVF